MLTGHCADPNQMGTNIRLECLLQSFLPSSKMVSAVIVNGVSNVKVWLYRKWVLKTHRILSGGLSYSIAAFHRTKHNREMLFPNNNMYSRTSVARTLMARSPRLFRTRS